MQTDANINEADFDEENLDNLEQDLAKFEKAEEKKKKEEEEKEKESDGNGEKSTRLWRQKRKELRRPITFSKESMEKKLKKTLISLETDLEEEVKYIEKNKPKTRADCKDSIKPCPFVSCQYHLYLDVTERGGLVIYYPSLDPDQMPEQCILDIAEKNGGITLEDIADLMNLTRERVRQLEDGALEKLKNNKEITKSGLKETLKNEVPPIQENPQKRLSKKEAQQEKYDDDIGLNFSVDDKNLEDVAEPEEIPAEST